MTLRAVTSLILALVIAITSIAVGTVRGQADAEGQMVLCTGHGPVVIHYDENGNPTGAPHRCPDCVMSLFDAVWDVPTALAAEQIELTLELVTVSPGRPLSVPIEGKARAPPRRT